MNAKAGIVITAIVLDTVVLGAFLWIKGTSDIIVVIVSVVLMALIFIMEYWFLNNKLPPMNNWRRF